MSFRRFIAIRRASSRVLLVFLLFAKIVVTPSAAAASVVTDWNAIVFQIGGPVIQRTLAMVHIAMFDAVNSIDRGYAPYRSLVSAPPGTSAEAAASAAAKGILVRIFPAQQVLLDAALQSTTASIPNGSAKSQGFALGDQIAAALFADRINDNMLAPNPTYVPIGGPGFYQLTPPALANPVNILASTWRPFAMLTADQFRSNGPLPITHPKYAADFEEVRLIGSATSPFRTAEQTLIAMWHTEQGGPAFNRIARAESARQEFDLLTTARLFALLNIALTDAATSVFDTKYAFNYWRPVTAIRQADLDNNPHTTADPAWTPAITTPPHPEYPSAHGTVGMAAVQVMEAFFGQHYAFESTSSAVPGVTRLFASFRDYASDFLVARIYGGIHFRTAVEEGARQGKKVGNWVLEQMLLPAR